MSAEGKTSPRERLLEAAASCVYVDGVGVGVEALCKAAGVSKRSMYQLFESKDELLAASLERRAPGFAGMFGLEADDGRSPRARILRVFELLEENSASPDYHGCPYLAVQVELKDVDHPAHRVAQKVKDELTAFFRGEAERGGARDPELLARQLTLVFDGASARGGARAEVLEGLVVPMAAVLLDAAGLRRLSAEAQPNAWETPSL
ncbi:TetR/AcrR family transcriptional regulator [Streptosporangiaceae bacterium NEAU-GS5]|nr:TetR/AcrR family transcriptional regulator [Streptosporangiaceae bacterium NEAU-GS5]